MNFNEAKDFIRALMGNEGVKQFILWTGTQSLSWDTFRYKIEAKFDENGRAYLYFGYVQS